MSNLGNLKSRRPVDAKWPGVTGKTSQAGMNAVSEDKSRTPTDAKPSYVTSKTSQLPSAQN